MTPWLPWEERFWRNIDKGSSPDACWLWMGSKSKGYGTLRVHGKSRRVHRLALELAGRQLDQNLTVDHLCRHRSCVNPAHLEQVTSRENTMRGEGQAVQNLRKTECPKGHPYSGSNLYVRPEGHRDCRRCHADYQAERARRRRFERVQQMEMFG